MITLNQTAFFRSGAAEFDPEMYPTLEKIASALARIDNPIRMEGHTDSLPIHNERFSNNWELRAPAALRCWNSWRRDLSWPRPVWRWRDMPTLPRFRRTTPKKAARATGGSILWC